MWKKETEMDSHEITGMNASVAAIMNLFIIELFATLFVVD